MMDAQAVEIRGFKWPNRPTSIATASLVGEDNFGKWLGIARGGLWWNSDRTRTGVFDHSFVKLVPRDTFWTACFHTIEPAIDVDIVLPVRWYDGFFEEVDLDLDVLRSADGRVYVRDQEEFEQLRRDRTLSDDVAEHALATCAEIRQRVETGAEPFETIGALWLSRWVRHTSGHT